MVVLAWRAVGRFLPSGVDQALALKAAKQGIQGAFAGSQGPAELGQRSDELVAVARLGVDEGEHAELDHAAAGLA